MLESMFYINCYDAHFIFHSVVYPWGEDKYKMTDCEKMFEFEISLVTLMPTTNVTDTNF